MLYSRSTEVENAGRCEGRKVGRGCAGQIIIDLPEEVKKGK